MKKYFFIVLTFIMMVPYSQGQEVARAAREQKVNTALSQMQANKLDSLKMLFVDTIGKPLLKEAASLVKQYHKNPHIIMTVYPYEGYVTKRVFFYDKITNINNLQLDFTFLKSVVDLQVYKLTIVKEQELKRQWEKGIKSGGIPPNKQ